MNQQAVARKRDPPPPPCKDRTLPALKRVADLFSRMTSEEKAGQTVCVWQHKAQTLMDAQGNFDPQKVILTVTS